MLPPIGQSEALRECCSKFKLCIPLGFNGRQQRISLLYKLAGLSLNSEVSRSSDKSSDTNIDIDAMLKNIMKVVKQVTINGWYLWLEKLKFKSLEDYRQSEHS